MDAAAKKDTASVEKVYLVSKGSYSDYSVVAIMEDKTVAEKIVEVLNEESKWVDAEMEEFLIFQGTTIEKIPIFSSCTELRDDFVVKATSFDVEYVWNFARQVIPKRPQVKYQRCFGDVSGNLNVTGRSEKTVAKVTSERIAAFKARSWIPQGEKAIQQ